MDDKERYLGSYSDGSRPLLCAASHQPITGRHHSNYRLHKGSGFFFCILTKVHHRQSPEDVEEIRERLLELVKPTVRARKAQLAPPTEKDKE